MNRINGLILCEGNSDQVLLGLYLSKICGWKFTGNPKNLSFRDKPVIWYVKNKGEMYGIWAVGGNDFSGPIKEIMELEVLEHTIEKVAVVTDHDDSEAETDRPRKIFETMNETVSIENYDLQEMLSMNNTWQDISFEGSFGKSVVQFCYLLIPSDSQGALETFMLDALSEDSEAKKEAVLQVKQFVAEFRSNFYLTKRRQKVKAELGISLSVFNPERLFDTFMELINSIDWASFQAVGKQFDVLLEI